MGQLLTPRPGTYILDPIQQRLLSPNTDVVDSEDPLVAKYRGKWATPTPGTPAAEKTEPTNGTVEADEAPAAPAAPASQARTFGTSRVVASDDEDDE